MKKYILRPQTESKKLKIDYQAHLNPQQYEVVTKADGPCLVLAGAGSGKTRTLIYRVAYLLDKKVNPGNILLVTFTNKAAKEMLTRVELLLGFKPRNLWGGTFHHIGNLILRKYAKNIGYTNEFSILDREDSRSLIDECIREVKLDSKKKFPKASVVDSIFSLSVNSTEPVEHIIEKKFDYFEDITDKIKKVLTRYTYRKKLSNNMDYNDLLLNWLVVMGKYSEIKDKISQNFKYILVDEFQDTNRLQFEILKRLAECHKNILVVGDDSQSIYSFRAAEIKNMLDFPKFFPDTKIFKLEINYRSTPEILNLTNESISYNKNQFKKRLKAERQPGQKPVVLPAKDVNQEAEFCAQRILELREEGIPLREIAILFRARYQAQKLELELMKRDIPYIIRGGVRFFEQAHIKDMLSFLKILINPKDELSWKRALKLYPGIGRKLAHRIWEKIKNMDNPIPSISKNRFKIDLPKSATYGIKSFLATIKTISKEQLVPAKIIYKILNPGYRQYLKLTFEDAEDRLLDINQLIIFSRAYKSVRKMLKDISSHEEFRGETIRGAANEEDEYIVLTTIHQAKGLEWMVVILIGACEGQFPHPKTLEDEEQLEEERRLFYVASTRAKSLLYITYPLLKYNFTQDRVTITKPSRFIQELPSSCYQQWQIERVEVSI